MWTCIWAMALMAAGLVAQARPDFSGVWTAEPDPHTPSTAGRQAQAPVYGAQFVIDHQGQTLTLTRTFAGGSASIRHVLDGSETTSRMPGRLCEPDSSATWTASWDADALAITMIGAVPRSGKPVKMDVRRVLRLESKDVLRVEVTARAPGQSAPRISTGLYRDDLLTAFEFLCIVDPACRSSARSRGRTRSFRTSSPITWRIWWRSCARSRRGPACSVRARVPLLCFD
jgi:hypothetical protein